MALVSLSCVFSPFKSSVTAALGGAVGFGACAMGAGVFATGGAVLFTACGARVVTLGLGTGIGAGREVADGGDVTSGCGVRDALVAGGGDGAWCPRPAQAFNPKIAAAIIQICGADIIFAFPTYLADARALSELRLWSPLFRRDNLRTIGPLAPARPSSL